MESAYPLLFALGVLGSLLWLAWRGPDLEAPRRLDGALCALVGGLVGARLGFVITHLDYYLTRPVESLWFWQGGLSWAVGAAGALIGLAIYASTSHQSIWLLADTLAVPAAVVALVSWTGCLFDGCAYGRRTDLGLFTPASPDQFGWISPRWPTQIVGMVTSIAALLLATWLQSQRITSGLAAALVMACISASALGLAFARADPVPMLWGLRGDAVGSAAVLLVSFALITARSFKR